MRPLGLWLVAALAILPAAPARAGCAWDQMNNSTVNYAYPLLDTPFNAAYGQSFVPLVGGMVGCLNITLSRVGTPGTGFVYFEVRQDAGGVPAGTIMGWTCATPGWAQGFSPGVVSCSISCNTTALLPCTTYWVVVRGTFPPDPANYVNVHGQAPQTYPGIAMHYDGFTWTAMPACNGLSIWFEEGLCATTSSCAPTVSPSPVLTCTDTPTPTCAPSLSASCTVPPTPTETRTRTDTRTFTNTVPSSTYTATRTNSPTRTVSPTATESPTSTPSATSSATRSGTVTRTPTPTAAACDAPQAPPFLVVEQNVLPPGGTVKICWALAKTEDAKVRIANSAGEEVIVLREGPCDARKVYAAVWDGTVESGAPAAAGVYVVRIDSTSFRAIRKLGRAR